VASRIAMVLEAPTPKTKNGQPRGRPMEPQQVSPYGNTRTRPAHTTGLLVLGS